MELGGQDSRTSGSDCAGAPYAKISASASESFIHLKGRARLDDDERAVRRIVALGRIADHDRGVALDDHEHLFLRALHVQATGRAGRIAP